MAGASFDIWPDPVETLPLTKIYRRRAHLSHRMNLPSLGFDEAVAQLSACGLQHLILGLVRSPGSGYRFQFFLTPDASRVVACLGVRKQ